MRKRNRNKAGYTATPVALDLRPERQDLRPERPDLRPEGPDEGGMNEWTDKRMNEQKSPVFYRLGVGGYRGGGEEEGGENPRVSIGHQPLKGCCPAPLLASTTTYLSRAWVPLTI